VNGRVSLHPGMDGIPFRTRRTTTPDYKGSDPDHKKPMHVTDMHVDIFDLGDETQRAEMARILSKCAKGRAYESSRNQEFDRNTGTFKVLLVWGEFFLEDPKESKENEIHEYQ
jgi:hypothetical protein